MRVLVLASIASLALACAPSGGVIAIPPDSADAGSGQNAGPAIPPDSPDAGSGRDAGPASGVPTPEPAKTYTLTLDVRGPGAVRALPLTAECRGTCKLTFDAGTRLSLRAVADAIGAFGRWTGDCAGLGACDKTVNRDLRVGAAFSVRQVIVWVQLAGDGEGRVTSEPPGIDCAGPADRCSATFPMGTRLILWSRAKLLSTTRGFNISACTGRSCDVTTNLFVNLAVVAYFDTQRYSVVDLGTPDPLHWAESLVISPNGRLGAGSEAGELIHHLFLWDGSFHEISSAGLAAAVNDLGTVSGNQWGPTAIAGKDAYRAFRWQNGMFTLLDTLGGVQSFAHGITAAGTIFGEASRADGSGRAVHWVDRVPVDLGSLGGCSEAFAGNSHGIIVGSSCTPASGVLPVRFNAPGAIDVLGTLGGPYGSAMAINESGVIVGEAIVPSGDGHAFFHVDGRMVDLGTVSGTTATALYALNDEGIAVGSAWNVDTRYYTGVVATSERLLDLRKLVPPGVEVTSASSIDRDGDIAANADIRGESRVVILRPIP